LKVGGHEPLGLRDRPPLGNGTAVAGWGSKTQHLQDPPLRVWVTSHSPGTPDGLTEDLGCVRFLNDVGFPYACDLLGVYRDAEHTYALSSEHLAAAAGDMAKVSRGRHNLRDRRRPLLLVRGWSRAERGAQGGKRCDKKTHVGAFRVAWLRATRGKSWLTSVPTSFAWRRCCLLQVVQPIARQLMEGIQQLHDFGIAGTLVTL